VVDLPRDFEEPGVAHGRSAQGSAPRGAPSSSPGLVSAGESWNVLGAAPVSVVIPCYKCTATIGRAVTSVVEQSWRPAELILADDGNTDETGNALRVQQKRLGSSFVRIIQLPRNQGAAAARNAGWEAATQPYVAFLDADDTWHPQKIELQLRFMLEHSDVQVSSHRLRWVGEGVPMQEISGGIRAKAVTKWRLLLSNSIVTSSVILRSDLPLRFDAGKRHSEDYGLWLAVAARGLRIIRLDAQLACSYKAPFGTGGLSAALWKMERGELSNYRALRKARFISVATWLAVSSFSLAKYARRLLIVWSRRSPRLGRS
jgi:glycosyltransferase involved in cell wall biosynthesis